MNLHERYDIVESAYLELTKAFIDVIKKYDLTHWESAGIAHELLAIPIKYGKRKERHPNEPDKKADEE